MLSLKHGRITAIIHKDLDKTIAEVKLKDKDFVERVINYNDLTGEIQEGDLVVLNTTAIDLNLGTGGYHFVIYNLNNGEKSITGSGHIMKLRYTPMQIKVCAAEEQDSPYHQVFLDFKSLNGFPVIVALLHSMVLPISATIKYYEPEAKIAYIMSDAGSLPIAFSDTVKILQNKGLIDKTITYGHAFGGDIECINIYNSLIAAKNILGCDYAITSMGPGIVGSGTPYGFSGIEQGAVIDAINTLGGKAIAIPRISFADQRSRHRGISHHSQTIFGSITKTKCYIPIPKLPELQASHLMSQIKSLKLHEKHYIVEVKANELSNILAYYNLQVNTMGRGLLEDPTFFLACCGGGLLAIEKRKGS
ncbi:DUF3866 family protein [Alkaliphilus serpentinus]|uniref:DUF3866 family protein n=1 Tax=Alkaliphilus serpentinus TaxID=1482731 RepID=A0A833M7D3_9FIRM|nr:DUF3866 family protein [Alkaliphilus serpentinus]KAB3527377.1 DUF3866 family protein [Alkaliphilus serpentinus]